jgi:hypothetical protein
MNASHYPSAFEVEPGQALGAILAQFAGRIPLRERTTYFRNTFLRAILILEKGLKDT